MPFLASELLKDSYVFWSGFRQWAKWPIVAVHTERPSTTMLGMITSVKMSVCIYKHVNDLDKLIPFMFVPNLYLVSAAPPEILFGHPGDV